MDAAVDPLIDGGGVTTERELRLPDDPTSRTGGAAAALGPVSPAVLLSPRRGAPDRFARRVLCVRDLASGQEIHNIFSASMALSGTRCLLSYIVLPVLAPWLGALPLIGPAIGIPVGVLALVFDVRAMRRFFQADHRWRWVAAAVYLVVMIMVTGLVIGDISRLA